MATLGVKGLTLNGLLWLFVLRLYASSALFGHGLVILSFRVHVKLYYRIVSYRIVWRSRMA